MENTVFIESITQPKSFITLLPIVIIFSLLIVLLIGLLAGIIFSVKHTSISIQDNNVVIKSFIYGRKIPIEDIAVSEIKTVNLNQDKEYNISVRTNGIGLPNFYSGWMRLNNGQKALVFLTNRENVLLIPANNFVVLFSMEGTEDFKKVISERR